MKSRFGRVHTYCFAQKQAAPSTAKAEGTSDSEDSSASDDEDGEDDESDDPTGTKALIAQGRRDAGEKARAERKAKRKSDAAEAARLAGARRSNGVNLNKISSISGAGNGSGASRSPGLQDRSCHTCGSKGHLKMQCPQLGAGHKRRAP